MWSDALRDAGFQRAGFLQAATTGYLNDDCQYRPYDYPCPSIWPARAGDLDGDGSDELFTVEHAFQQGWTLVARHAADALEMWRAPVFVSYTGEAYIGRVDVNGDGRDEIAVFDVSETDAGERVSPADAFIASLQQRLRVLNAATGALLWSHETPATVVVAGAAAYVEAFTDVVQSIAIMPDATGDGSADLFQSSATYALAGVAYVTAFSGETIDGKSGDVAATFTWRGAQDYIDTFPVNDVNGDGRGDLFVFDSSSMSAYSADGSAMYWSMPTDWGSSWVAYMVPLRDAHSTDVLVYSSSFGSSGHQYLLRAFSGADGSEMWNFTPSYSWRLFIRNDVDGDGGLDLAYYAAVFDRPPPFGWISGYTVQTWSGANAGVLWSNTYAVDSAPPGFPCCAWQDFNGDGKDDLLFESWTEDPASGAITGVRVVGFDGASGAQLWDRSLPGYVNVAPTDDVDGDGIDDLVLIRNEWDVVGQAIEHLDVVSASDERSLGSVSERVVNRGVWWAFGANLPAGRFGFVTYTCDYVPYTYEPCHFGVEGHDLAAGQLWRLDPEPQ